VVLGDGLLLMLRCGRGSARVCALLTLVDEYVSEKACDLVAEGCDLPAAITMHREERREIDVMRQRRGVRSKGCGHDPCGFQLGLARGRDSVRGVLMHSRYKQHRLFLVVTR